MSDEFRTGPVVRAARQFLTAAVRDGDWDVAQRQLTPRWRRQRVEDWLARTGVSDRAEAADFLSDSRVRSAHPATGPDSPEQRFWTAYASAEVAAFRAELPWWDRAEVRPDVDFVGVDLERVTLYDPDDDSTQFALTLEHFPVTGAILIDATDPDVA